jgi:DNA polymerase-3 subunit delta
MRGGDEMALNEKDLKQDLKETLRTVYLLYGEESYLTTRYEKVIVDKAVEEDLGGFNFQKFDGDTAVIDQIEEAIDALPLMAQRKCVLIRDLDFEKAEVAERLLPLMQDPPETTVIVLAYPHLTPKPNKTNHWGELFEAVKQNGVVVNFAKKTPAEMVAVLCAGATRRGCVLSKQNAMFLIDQCSDDMILLGNELDKLCALADGGEITAAMIDKTATKNLEAKVYDLSKMILRRRRDEAYGLLNQLLQQREEPLAILGALTSTYVDMYRVKVALTSGRSTQEVADAFETAYKRKEFRLRYAAQDASRMSVLELRKALTVLAQADTALKSSRTAPRFILEQTVAKLM